MNFIKNQNINNRLYMVKIQFLENEFELDMEGLEEFEAFKKKLRIPYTSIKNVEDTAGDVFGKFKIMGTRLTQNSHDYGSFTTDEGEGFFSHTKQGKMPLPSISPTTNTVSSLLNWKTGNR